MGLCDAHFRSKARKGHRSGDEAREEQGRCRFLRTKATDGISSTLVAIARAFLEVSFPTRAIWRKGMRGEENAHASQEKVDVQMLDP